MNNAIERRPFPAIAAILLGLGLGGFFDGIVLHQILQWHHMLTSGGYAVDSLQNLKLNVVLDGVFHSGTFLFTVAGLLILWKAARRPHFLWAPNLLFASLLIGFGTFNIVEGITNHHLLELHHVNETVPGNYWIYWDVGFPALGSCHAGCRLETLRVGKAPNCGARLGRLVLPTSALMVNKARYSKLRANLL